MGNSDMKRHTFIAILLVNLFIHGGNAASSNCQTADADLVFIVDSSGSVGQTGYNQEINFVKTIVNNLTIGPDDVRVGFIDYSTVVHTSLGFNLNDPMFDSQAEIIAHLDSLPYSKGYTRTDLAIEAAKNMFAGPGNRALVPDILITLTDGATNNGGKQFLDDRVDELKAMFPELTSIAVGVKNFDVFELNYIASNSSLIYTVTNFANLDTLLSVILQEICTPPPPEVCIGETCQSTNQCKDDNAVCIPDGATKICQCKHGFILNQKGECVDCHSVNFQTFLSNFPCSNISFCAAGEVLVGDDCYGTQVSESCTSTLDTCTNDHASCSGSVCQCDTDYTWNGNQCVGAILGLECSTSPSDSCAVNNLVCNPISGRCECPPESVQFQGECYGTRVTQNCTSVLDTCVDCFAECNGEVCECVTGFTWNGHKCVGSQLDEPCQGHPDSCAVNGLVCGLTSRCECPSHQIQVDNTCYSLTCDECQTNSDCLYQNQVCVPEGETKICACAEGFYLDFCGECSPKLTNGSACYFDGQCLSGFCICGFCEPNADGDCCDDCTDFRSDLVFVADASGTVGKVNYEKLKAFILALGNVFHISQDDTRIGSVDYSYGINFKKNLDEFQDNFDFTLSIGSQPHSSGTTRTDLGLDEARNILLGSGNRPGIPNFVIVLTDGMTTEPYATDNLPTSISQLKAVPETEIFAIGIGNFDDTSELYAIASSPDNVFTTASFDTLKNLIAQLLLAICTDGN